MIAILHQLEPAGKQSQPDRDLARQLRDLAAEAGRRAKAATRLRAVNASRILARDAAQIGVEALAATRELACIDCGAPTGGWRLDLCRPCWEYLMLDDAELGR